MRKKYAPHEPEEDVLSAEDAFRDAEQSEARWQTFKARSKAASIAGRAA